MHPFAQKLISWFERHQRELPWRKTKDPYAIWLSEIILQQTRVKQGLAYYEQFLQTFPTIFDLAKASQEEVLRLWQGLGYYTRARNLHHTAQYIVAKYQGRFPSNSQELQKLKGIGKYTAAAIASFAFDEPIPVIDGNVYRVLARLFAIESDISSPTAYRTFEQVALELLPASSPAIFNQAIMEFGAIQCTPQNPACITCIFFNDCRARILGKQHELPKKSKKIKSQNRYFHYFVVVYQDKILMKERLENDIWKGLYDFPLLETEAPLSEREILEICKQKFATENISFSLPYHKHALTHQTIWTLFIRISFTESSADVQNVIKSTNAQLYTLPQIQKLPKPILIASFIQQTSLHFLNPPIKQKI
ncbi:MAG: A/G-specific adenine glycosylase [Cytophagales bacterium]|nr:A/G-specific adenine glycosylase [Cytophagales bacterium]MDW8383660.1 A/G-specific adenine glycosylase [Flammeovirgaceae bacterium]